MHKIFLILLIILSIYIYIWQQDTSTIFAYKVTALQADYDEISSENDTLRFKINSMLALDKMDKIAKEKNINHPDEKSIIYID
jgi:cell division protein FtsL